MKQIITLLLISIFSITGCTSAINEKSATNHSRAAISASQAGDWNLSRRHWAKAVVNSRLAHKPEQEMAVLNYEYGRALGVTCSFDEAKKYLNLAYQQDINTGGPSYNDLIELARLHLDQKKWNTSITYFIKAFPVLEKAKAHSEAPHAYADILTEYALALDKAGKKGASHYRNKADSIRKKYKRGFSITERTPYGTQCNNR